MSISALLSKLRQLEAAVPARVRQDPNFGGLRVDAEGSAVYVGKYNFPDGNYRVNADPAGLEVEIYADPVFQGAMEKAKVVPASRIDPTQMDLSSSCYAGDGAYAVGPDDLGPERARISFGTLGWFFFLDDVPAAVSCSHVLCHGSINVPPNETPVYQRTAALDTDVRLGSVWKSYLEQADARRIFDIALARLENPSAIVTEFGLLDDGSQRAYPQSLADEKVIVAGESYHLVGAATRTGAETSFQGVGSRRQEDGSMLCEQLFFNKCSAGGDSGAIIVHSPTNTVVGVCAMTGVYTVASPLYRKGWKAKGMQTAGGFTLPAFCSTEL